MNIRNCAVTLTMSTLLFAATAVVADELPAGFPGDVPVADYMEVVGVTEVRDDLAVDLRAPGQTLAGVVEWCRSGLAAAGSEALDASAQ